MTKDISTGGGAAIEGSVDTGGGQMTGRDDASHRQRNSQRSDMQQSVNFSNPDSMQLYLYLTAMDANIRELTVKMDDLPNRVSQLELARLEVARTAITAAQAAAALAAQTADAAAHLAASKTNIPLTGWLIIGMLFLGICIGIFFVGRAF